MRVRFVSPVNYVPDSVTGGKSRGISSQIYKTKFTLKDNGVNKLRNFVHEIEATVEFARFEGIMRLI